MSEWKNEVETLAPDPRKLPPWHLTGIVVCYKGTIGFSSYVFRERWENADTGEIELRPTTVMSIERKDAPPVVERHWWEFLNFLA